MEENAILASYASSLSFVCTKKVQSCITKVLKSDLWHKLVHNLDSNPWEAMSGIEWGSIAKDLKTELAMKLIDWRETELIVWI